MKTLKIVRLVQETDVIEMPPSLDGPPKTIVAKTPGPTMWRMTVANEKGKQTEVSLTYGQFDKIRQLLKE